MPDDSPYPKPLLRSAATPWISGVTALMLVATVPVLHAASSPVGVSGATNELTQSQVLEHLYGGVFTQQGSNDFSNGSVTVQRVDDISVAEQIFQGELVSAHTVASFSRNTQTFGLREGGRIVPLFTASGIGLQASGSADLTGRDLSNAIFALQSGGAEFDAAERGDVDHLLSYAVTGLEVNKKAALLFWEDASEANAAFDYNDLVVELAGRGTASVLIPLPAAAWSGLTLLCGVGIMTGLRTRLRQGSHQPLLAVGNS